VAAEELDELGPPDEDRGLRVAEQLVAGEADEICAGFQACAGRWLVAERHAPTSDEGDRAQVVNERQPRSVRCPDEVGELRLLREADDTEVRLVDAEQEGRLWPNCALVVGGARTVRRPDLTQARARAREHVGDPEAVADLDQLPAGDEHLSSLGQGGKRGQDGSSVVVDYEGRLGAGQSAENRGHVVLARATSALPEVVFEVRVAAGDRAYLLQRVRRQRSAAEIRVDDHAGGVDDTAEARSSYRLELGLDALAEVAGVGAGLDFFTRAGESGTSRRDQQRAWCGACEPLVPGELVHGRQVPQLHGRSVER